ncbi:hypothetical protein K466DRAFT_492102 [Polyporus arcularius HHB13444]|uniref:RING-type domain-containing protein n=2 Tax=Polyporaceae TaxID=5317 RepID=A0A5C3PBX2_9APHY|nr:hypothetical protein K466DRAFT_492102 [Polyporus arcularius HHB13444]
MLVVHPSSQCDVCLDPYTWTLPAKTPHAIQCGHIFCYDCLRSTHPSNCPMCRKAFNPERIKKLHVDRAPGETSAANSGHMAEEDDLLRRVGLLFAEDAQQEDINELQVEVEQFLGPNPGNTVSISAFIG